MRILLVLLMLQGVANAEMVDASFYTKESAQREGTSGIFTASGEKFNENSQTCAHPSLPFGTILRVKNPQNGIWFYCRVNDRGPARNTGHDLDLTPRGFKLLKIPLDQGIARLKIERKK